MEMPFFSVVMPVYNAGYDALRRAMGSVASQSFEDWELIVVDDGSTNGVTGYVLDSFKADSRIILWTLKGNSGSPVVPRNFGVEKSRGEWLAFLDSDDEWRPDKLERVRRFMAPEFPAFKKGLYYHDMELRGSRRGRLWSDLSRCYDGNVFDRLLVKNFIPTSSVVVPRAVWRPMDSRLRISHDWDLWLELCREIPVCYVPEVLGTLTLRGGSVITNTRRRRAESREVVRRHRRHGSLKARVLATLYYYLVEVWDYFIY